LDEIESLIHKAISEDIKNTKHRDYLGASCLGEECERKLWYMYHIPKNDHEPRTQMIFDFGHMIEEYAAKIIKKAFKVWEVDSDGEQFGFVKGPIAGHCDGFIQLDDVCLLEIKSMNKARFNAVKKHGVKNKEHRYWVQMQIYMAEIFPDIEKALYFAINKDTCEIYTELIDIERGISDIYITRGNQVIESPVPFQRKYSKKSFYKCKMCDYNDICWSEDECKD